MTAKTLKDDIEKEGSGQQNKRVVVGLWINGQWHVLPLAGVDCVNYPDCVLEVEGNIKTD